MLNLGLTLENPFLSSFRNCFNHVGGEIKMNKKNLGVLLVISLAFAGVASASGQWLENQDKPNFDPTIHEQLEAAIESGDYAEWIRLREENNLPMRGRIFSVITEENFNLFADLHEAREEGNIEEAQEIREQLGLGIGQGKMGPAQRGRGQSGFNGKIAMQQNQRNFK